MKPRIKVSHIKADKRELTPAQEKQRRDKNLDKFIAELSISTRSMNALDEAGILKVRDLIKKKPAEMLNIQNFGVGGLEEVTRALLELDLALKGE